ncbi:MAG TPA: 3'-5' exonuclease [Dehalococcoidia bacterium]|nr:3'-5' exonuclease [Dehalococcoidia bacterium]
MKNLRFDKPLTFIDVETTGLNPYSDRIVELSILKIHPDGTEEYKSHRINPEIPIPAETTAIHGITNADVVSEPAFHQYARSIRDFLEDCDIAGFNVIKFDLPFLEAELTRANVEFSRQGRYLIDSQVIYHQRDPRNLQAAYKKYCGKEMDNAHSAEADAKAAAEILNGQLEMYQDLPKDIAGLSALCYEVEENTIDIEGKFIWSEGEALCNFGKHKGRLLREIAIDYPEYLEWISRGNFSLEVKKIVIRALNGEFPEPP